MATIALYAGKLNQMPSLINEVKKNVNDYSSELFSLKSKALKIRKSVCDLDDVIGMIQASTQLQDQKIESLEAFCQKTEEFIADTVRIDEEAAVVINQSKEDFYNNIITSGRTPRKVTGRRSGIMQLNGVRNTGRRL